MKTTLKILLAVIVTLHGVLLFYFGIAAITTTVLLYVLLGYVGLWLIGLISKSYNAANIKLLWVALMLALFAGELAVKYLRSSTATFKEKFRSIYVSEYKRIRIQSLLRRIKTGQDTAWYFTDVPNTQRVLARDGFSYLHSYNAEGLRENKSLEKSDTTKLILAIGDSFAEGNGAPQDSTWVALLQTVWNEAYSPCITTYNAGKAGSDPFYECKLLEKLLTTFNPTVVILTINSSDIDDIVFRGGASRFLPNGTVTYKKAPWWEPLYATSFIARRIIELTKGVDWTLLKPTEKQTAREAAIDSLDACIQQFAVLGKQYHFTPVVVFNPLADEIGNGPLTLNNLYLKTAENNSVIAINLLTLFTESGAITKDNSQNYYWKEDHHNNSDGYHLWAITLARVLNDHQVIKEN